MSPSHISLVLFYLLIMYLCICCGADVKAQVFSCPVNTGSQTQVIGLGGKYSYLLVCFACMSPVFSGHLVSFPHSKVLYVNQVHLQNSHGVEFSVTNSDCAGLPLGMFGHVCGMIVSMSVMCVHVCACVYISL